MILSLALTSLSLSAALAAEPAGPAAPAKPQAAAVTYAPAKAAEAKENQMVCRNEPVLGSRLPVRRCRTVADIRDRQLQDREAIEHAQIIQEPSK